jgi:phosphate starvation-inducible PhoH-like protein
LPASRHSGLIEVQAILKGVPGITFTYFDEQDVVRHRLVSAIIRAYGAHEARTPAPPSAAAPAVREDEATTGED